MPQLKQIKKYLLKPLESVPIETEGGGNSGEARPVRVPKVQGRNGRISQAKGQSRRNRLCENRLWMCCLFSLELLTLGQWLFYFA